MKIRCGNCNHSFDVPDGYPVGEKIKCPKCKKSLNTDPLKKAEPPKEIDPPQSEPQQSEPPQTPKPKSEPNTDMLKTILALVIFGVTLAGSTYFAYIKGKSTGWSNAVKTMQLFMKYGDTIEEKYNVPAEKTQSFSDDDLRRKEDKVHHTNLNYTGNFSQVVFDWLGAGMIVKANDAMKSMMESIPTLGPTEATAMLGAYVGARPEATLDEGMRAVEITARLPEEGRIPTIKLAGELKHLMPEKTMDDIFGITIGMRQSAGKYKDNLSEMMGGVWRLKLLGVSGEESLAVLLTALKTKQDPNEVTAKLIDLISNERYYIVPGYDKRWGMKHVGTRLEKLTKEEKIQLKLSKMTPAERFKWIIQNTGQASDSDQNDFAVRAEEANIPGRR